MLIQSQARELSQLRQRQQQARGLSGVLTQQLSDATKAFEELLRSNDVDFLSARSFREQLAHSAALLERLGAKLGAHGQCYWLPGPSETFSDLQGCSEAAVMSLLLCGCSLRITVKYLNLILKK